MNYFNRVCRVDIADISFENQRINFEIKKSIEASKNTVKIDIYNLSQTTRNKITTDDTNLVRVFAGYSQNIGLVEIGQGNISNIIHTIKSPDIVSTILCKDGFEALRNKKIALSFNDKTLLSSIINKITGDLALPVKFLDYDKTLAIKNGYSFVGTIADSLNDLGNQYGFNWSIQNGQILIIPKNKSSKIQSVFLSASTGLIESPELVIETKDLIKASKNEYNITSLLQPQIEVGDLVEIDSITLKGTFIVNELTHVGDTRAQEWYTKMIVINNA